LIGREKYKIMLCYTYRDEYNIECCHKVAKVTEVSVTYNFL